MTHTPSLLLVFLVLATVAFAQQTPAPQRKDEPFKLGERILFQGDSITDGNRGRNADPNHVMGHGYAFILAAKYGAEQAERNLTFLNRGVSADTVARLAARWQADTIDLKPDVLSILIGVNDLNGNVTAEAFEAQYDQLLRQTLQALPAVRLVLLEPFGLPTGKKATEWAAYHAELAKRQTIVARLAQRHGATFVPLQRAFEDAAKRAPAEHWIWDGIHPTYSGHQLIADAWMRAMLAPSAR